jgi:hypothetical protein
MLFSSLGMTSNKRGCKPSPACLYRLSRHPHHSSIANYGTIIPAQPQDDDPVLSLLAPSALALDADAYANQPDAYANNPAPNAYQRSPNLPAQPMAPVITRPSAFDKQPNINNASPTGQVRIMGAKNGRYDGEDDRNVKYINDLKTKREKYQIEIGATMLRRKMVFDTKEIKQHFEQKKKDSTGAANLGTD